jgi:hypothetical protein
MVYPGFISDFRNRGNEQQRAARRIAANLQTHDSLLWNKLKISPIKTQNGEVENFWLSKTHDLPVLGNGLHSTQQEYVAE